MAGATRARRCRRGARPNMSNKSCEEMLETELRAHLRTLTDEELGEAWEYFMTIPWGNGGIGIPSALEPLSDEFDRRKNIA